VGLLFGSLAMALEGESKKAKGKSGVAARPHRFSLFPFPFSLYLYSTAAWRGRYR
jgi:hypothetical protein